MLYIEISSTDKSDNLTCEIIYDNQIQLSLFCKNYRFSKTVLYIINRKIHGCLEIPDLFLVLNMFNTRNKSGISAHPCIILYFTDVGAGYSSPSRERSSMNVNIIRRFVGIVYIDNLVSEFNSISIQFFQFNFNLLNFNQTKNTI